MVFFVKEEAEAACASDPPRRRVVCRGLQEPSARGASEAEYRAALTELPLSRQLAGWGAAAHSSEEVEARATATGFTPYPTLAQLNL